MICQLERDAMQHLALGTEGIRLASGRSQPYAATLEVLTSHLTAARQDQGRNLASAGSPPH